ncbi:MAG: hypothetical protein ABJB33_04290 [Gemmatimonadota bacterium]
MLSGLLALAGALGACDQGSPAAGDVVFRTDTTVYLESASAPQAVLAYIHNSTGRAITVPYCDIGDAAYPSAAVIIQRQLSPTVWSADSLPTYCADPANRYAKILVSGAEVEVSRLIPVEGNGTYRYLLAYTPDGGAEGVVISNAFTVTGAP